PGLWLWLRLEVLTTAGADDDPLVAELGAIDGGERLRLDGDHRVLDPLGTRAQHPYHAVGRVAVGAAEHGHGLECDIADPLRPAPDLAEDVGGDLVAGVAFQPSQDLGGRQALADGLDHGRAGDLEYECPAAAGAHAGAFAEGDELGRGGRAPADDDDAEIG